MEGLITPLSFSVVLMIVCAVYIAGTAIYNLTFHPLAKYPGPKLRGAFAFPANWELTTGNSASNIKALHDGFGHVVRIGPNVLSFSSAQAWRDIHGHRKGQKNLERDPQQASAHPDKAPDIIVAGDADHARMRKIMTHAFSEAALRDQEPLILSYCDFLVKRLHEQIGGPAKGRLNIVSWLNFTTFDIIGDLAFGESFHALDQGEYHFWIATIFKHFKLEAIFSFARAYPPLPALLYSLLRVFPSVMKAKFDHENFTRDKTLRRLAQKTDRRDFTNVILRYNNEQGMTQDEIISNSSTFIIAGSETTATLLSGLVFNLLKSPRVLKLLQQEIRQTFKSSSDMTFSAEAKLPYMQACIEEGLRLYPPVPCKLSRITPPAGTVIDGEFVPGNISVGVHHLSASRSARNFRDPLEFVPERWMGDERYSGDDFAASQPFSLGSRGCIGRNLAYAEMRSILTRIIWNFDIELLEDSTNWDEQKVYTLWSKPPLNVQLSARSFE